MSPSFEERVAVAIAPGGVRAVGAHTQPRRFGVYRVPEGAGCARRYRFGAHPARLQDLGRRFGDCELVHLFLSRDDAEAVARHLNGLPPRRPH